MKTQFDWNLLRPEHALSEAHMSIVREITGTFLITGVGISDHQKRVELGKDRHLLHELVQVGLIRNVANCFYPTFAGLYFVESHLRDSYASTLAGMLAAFKALFEEKAPKRFAFQEIETELSALVLDINSTQLSKAVHKDARPLRAAIFLQDFPHYVTILESNYPGSPATSLMPTDTLLDYEDLEQAWKYELAQRPQPVAIAQVAMHAKASANLEISTTRRKKVFVIHGRDERLRAGIFAFLHALHLEPLEWINAIQLTGKASPYIGQVLDAAFTEAQAVVVLLSPDDEARLRPELLHSSDPLSEKELTGQARPNVLFEAGMSFASHADRTVLVQFGEVRPFSDIAGRHIVRMDNSGAKRQEFATKLKTAGCDLNTDGIEWHTAGDLTPPSMGVRTPESLPPRLSNLVSLDPLGTKIISRDRSDTWRDVALQGSESALPLWTAAIAVFRNEPMKGVTPRQIQSTTAQITFFDANGGEVQRVNNGTWLGTPFNSVTFSVGDTQELLIAMCDPVGRKTRTIENTRKRSAASTYEDAGSLEKLLERKLYDVTVRLIGMVQNRGDVNEEFRFSLDAEGKSPVLKRGWTK